MLKIQSWLQPLFRFTAKASTAIAILLFFVAGRVIHAITGTDRFLAEIEGLGLTFACILLTVITNVAGNHLDNRAAPSTKSCRNKSIQ